MKLYGIKMHNFMRFGESDNSIVFNVTKKQRENMADGEDFDWLYESLSADPLKYLESIDAADENILEGIIGISGMTSGSFDSSNGSGKSTIFEAMAFLFYDRVVRQTANNDKKAPAGLSVVTKLAGEYPKNLKESYVEAYFEEDGRVYRLKRGRLFTKSQKNNSPIFEFDCIKDQEVDSLSGHRKRDTKRSLEEVIVEDYDIFVNTVMFGQSDAGKFLVGTDKVKKDMIIELLKLEDIVHGCVDVIRAKKKVENDKLTNQLATVDSFQKMVIKEHLNRPNITYLQIPDYSNDLLDATINGLADQLKQAEDEKEKLSLEVIEIQKEIKKLEDSDVIVELKKLTEKGRELVTSKEQKEERKIADVKDWNKLLSESKIKVQDSNKSTVEIQVRLAANVKKVNEQEQTVKNFDEKAHDELIEKCIKAESLKEKYQTKLEQIEVRRESYIKKISAFDAAIKFRETHLVSLNKQVEEAGEGSEFICAECQSLVTKEHTLKKIADILEVVTKNTEIKKQLDVKLTKLDEARCTVQQKLMKIDQYRDHHQKLINEKQGLEGIKEVVKNINALIDQQNKTLEEKEKESTELNGKLVEYKKKCDDIEEVYKNEVSGIEKEIVEIRQIVTDKKSAAKEIESDIAKKKQECTSQKNIIAEVDKKCGSLQEKQDQIIDLGKQIAKEDKSIEKTRKQLQRHKILESAFGLEGVQTRIVAKYLPLLNMYIKQFLDVLSSGKLTADLFVNDKSKVDMSIVGGTADNYVMLSGGEKMIVRLAIDVGLSLLSFSRTSRTPDMICLDEIFGPLDPEHTKSVFLMLKELKGRFKKVFLISHKSEIQSLVENNIIVEKSSGNMGLSRITGIRDVTV